MASASKGRRSRKRRRAATGQVTTGRATTGAAPASGAGPKPPAGGGAARSAAPAAEAPAARSPQKAPPQPATTLGERPRAPWHPLPLSEILILIGAIATIVGLRRRADGTALLVVGLVAVGIGTFEVTLREHWSGYRSHAILLALVPVLAFHSLVIAIASAVANPTVLLSVVLLPFDLALFVFLFRLLRARFLDARQLRTVGRR